MSAVLCAQELQGAIAKAATVIDQLGHEKTTEAQEVKERLQTIVQRLRLEVQSVWTSDDSAFSSKYELAEDEKVYRSSSW